MAMEKQPCVYILARRLPILPGTERIYDHLPSWHQPRRCRLSDHPHRAADARILRVSAVEGGGRWWTD